MFINQKSILPLKKRLSYLYKAIYHSLVWFCIASFTLQAAENCIIIPIDSIKEIIPQLNKDVLFISDFDDTVCKSACMLATGSEAAKYFLKENKVSSNFDQDYQSIILNGYVEDNENLLQKINEQGDQQTVYTENEWGQVFALLEGNPIYSLILTSRQDNDPSLWRMLEKSRWKDKFNFSSFSFNEISRPAALPHDYPFKPTYKKAVIFTDLGNKAEALREFLSRCTRRFEDMIYVDNDYSKCLAIASFFKLNNQEGHVYHYQAIEKQFDKEKAAKVLAHLRETGVLLMDDEL